MKARGLKGIQCERVDRECGDETCVSVNHGDFLQGCVSARPSRRTLAVQLIRRFYQIMK